ncbi:cas scaffolding protein family member 4 isoform X2 [Pantherophis guttatus]|uniref:Cas scaffolding protein family member 4 isoform X2 n=1 Tax=Pantherophis guttatus TaxID=94885 RepID=A0A6P9D9N8_PANGU|nr:cas scaffolding protein family member 4 isoform X2 [Pantherophis guttatus]
MMIQEMVPLTTMDRKIGFGTLAKNTLAKALYDNKAECPDELAFRKGDILVVLEQNLLGSEGWWKCSLHGKQGLAPANRLQLLTSSQVPSIEQDFQELPTNPWTTYQVPSVHGTAAPLAVYEKMDGWINPPSSSSSTLLSPTQEGYRGPALAAKLLSEKTETSSNQHLFTLPRAIWASAPEKRNDVYDIPTSQHPGSLLTQDLATPPSSRKDSRTFPFMEWCPEKVQQLYDIPSNPEKPRSCPWQDCAVEDVYVIPTLSTKPISNSAEKHYKTLPNLWKSEWIYDVPVAPDKAKLMQTSQNHSPQNDSPHALYDIPPSRFNSNTPKISPINNKGKSIDPKSYNIPPVHRKLTCPELPLYDVPSTRDTFVQRPASNYDVPSKVLSTRIEKESQKLTHYDIPKGTPVALTPQKENNYNSGDNPYIIPMPSSTECNVDQDRLSVSSENSRTSTISTLSSSSTESFSSSISSAFSEEHIKETTMELELAIDTLTKLQHGVSSSVASLMIFVSSKWRYPEYLEGNIEEIHRAIDHIKVSLGEFLKFAQTIERNAVLGSDNKLQERIKKQLNVLSDSFQILVQTRDALNKCKWTLEILAIKKPQSNPDYLDQFVMVARTLPDDIKRFSSIIIANGKLLFKKSCKDKNSKDSKAGVELKMKKFGHEKPGENNSVLISSLDKAKENNLYSPVSVPEDCSTHLQKPLQMEQTQPTSKTKKHEEFKLKSSPPIMKERTLSKQDPDNRMILSSLSRLYFGAVQKAIGVFHKTLSDNRTPEIFIAKSKLIIMIGQKLVDTLCQEALEKTNRNDVLRGSSTFCGLLKSLAIATKNAAMKYPNPEAVKDLQDQADELSQFTQQFRDTME